MELVAITTPNRMSKTPISFSMSSRWRRNYAIQIMNGPMNSAATTKGKVMPSPYVKSKAAPLFPVQPL